jgi:hypothetical protein
MQQALIAAVIIVTGQTAFAANQFYMPGDAFFHTILTKKKLDEIEAAKSPIFEYGRPEFLPSMLCGYAGFRNLEYFEMPAAMKTNLRKTYEELREYTPRRVEIKPEVEVKKTDEGDVEVPTGREIHTEINGFSVLFYNSTFDMKKHRLGLKYNEKWADMFAAFGHKRDHAKLEIFVQTPEAVAVDWRDAHLVKPLQATLPKIETKSIGDPIRVKQGVIAIVLPKSDFKRLFRGEESGWGAMYLHVVTGRGVTQLESKNGHWSVRPPLQFK